MQKRIIRWRRPTAPKYVIHIGPTKTGSKYLQSILFYSRSALLEKGIAYPDAWWTKPDQIMHDPLLQMLRQERYDEVKEAFDRINSQGHRVVVLSCETIGDLEEAKLAALRDAIGNHPCEVVYYCRRWSDRIPSDWKQEIKMGRFPTFPEFFLSHLNHPFESAAVNYSLVWAKICRVFGRRSLRLISYNDLRDRQIDQFRHFAENFLDWNGEHGLDAGLIDCNVSPNLYDIEILRSLNWLDYQAVQRHRVNTRVKFLVPRSNWDTRVLESVMAANLATMSVSDDCEPFQQSWDAISAYAKCFVDADSRSEPFSRKNTEFSFVRSDFLLNDGALDELKALYRKFDELTFYHPAWS